MSTDTLVGAVIRAQRNGDPIPADIHAKLLEEGIDVDALTPSVAADEQLTFFHLLDDISLDAPLEGHFHG